MNKFLVSMSVLIFTGFSSAAMAYGDLTIENAVIRKVSCNFNTAVLDIKYAGKIEYLQNLAAAEIEGDFVRTSGDKRTLLGHKVQLVSINQAQDANLSGPIGVIKNSGQLSPNGIAIQRTYLVDASEVREDLINDRLQQCRDLEKLAKLGKKLSKPLGVARSASALVSTFDGQLDTTQLVIPMPLGEAVKNQIIQKSSCIVEIDGVGFSKTTDHEGNEIANCF